MAWTSITKPTGRPYTAINATGREQYDQSDITYDSSSTFYDGINQNAWSNILKPTGNSTVVILPGMATGLITPPTYSRQINILIDEWTQINKPI